jgi:HAMP domain-containing protein
LLREEIGIAADEAMGLWVAGGLEFSQTERLASRIETLKWILEIPAAKLAEAEVLIQEVAEMERTTRNPDAILTDPEEGYL